MFKIKYDLKIYTIVKIGTLISAVAFALGIVLLFLEIDGTEALCIYSLYIGGVLFIVFLYEFISAFFYFRRLKAYGYTVPKSKKTYGGYLQNLPRDGQNTVKSAYARYNAWAYKGSLILLILFVLWDVLYLAKWYFMGENSKTVFVMVLIFHVVAWFLFGFVMKKQSDVEKYRDDVETDANRKQRWTPSTIIVNVIILVLIGILAHSTSISMTKYVFETQVSSDRDRLYEIQQAINGAIEDGGNDILQMESYKDLEAGTDIVEWGVPDDEFEKAIAESLCIQDFGELNTGFYMSKSAGVYVRFSDGIIRIEMLNTYKEVAYSRRVADGKIFVE